MDFLTRSALSDARDSVMKIDEQWEAILMLTASIKKEA